MTNFKTAEKVCQEIEINKKRDKENALFRIIDNIVDSEGKLTILMDEAFSSTFTYLKKYSDLQKDLENLGYKFTIKKHWLSPDELTISACCEET